jgi:hypothetical protein
VLPQSLKKLLIFDIKPEICKVDYYMSMETHIERPKRRWEGNIEIIIIYQEEIVVIGLVRLRIGASGGIL